MAVSAITDKILVMRTSAAIPVARRISGFVYAIRNIVAEARKVEASGRAVRYLNIGDPITFGFQTPPHLIEAVERALRDGQNGYAPSSGIPRAREAVAAELSGRGVSNRRAARADRDRRSSQFPAARRRGLRRPRVRRTGAADGEPLSGRADHFFFLPVEGVPRARLARRLAGGRPDGSARRSARGDQKARGRAAVFDGTDGTRHRRGADGRPLAPGEFSRSPARARRADGTASQRH